MSHTDFPPKKKYNYHVEILKMTSPPSASLKRPEAMNMFMFHFRSLTAGHKMSLTFSMFVHCRLQVSTSHWCKVNVGQGLALKLVVMSQILIIAHPLKSDFQ